MILILDPVVTMNGPEAGDGYIMCRMKGAIVQAGSPGRGLSPHPGEGGVGLDQPRGQADRFKESTYKVELERFGDGGRGRGSNSGSETLWGVEKPFGRWGFALLPRWRPLGPAVGLPLGVKIPGSAELFSHCLSAVTALAGP